MLGFIMRQNQNNEKKLEYLMSILGVNEASSAVGMIQLL